MASWPNVERYRFECEWHYQSTCCSFCVTVSCGHVFAPTSEGPPVPEPCSALINHRRRALDFGPQEGTSRKKDIFDTPDADRWQLGGQNWCDQDPFVDRSEFYHVTTEVDSRAEAFVKKASGGKEGVFVVRRSLSEPAVSVSITYTESGSDEVFHVKVCHPQPRQRTLGLSSPVGSCWQTCLGTAARD
jgi:hypothetical protein